MSTPWWHGGVLYQIYTRSFADASGDGIGDLAGVLHRLEYLEWLGVDGIWLNPIHPSPNVDWGYDVADYTNVHPDLGTLADLDRLIAEAERHGIRVVLDLVPNHTSDRHPWFRERPDFYVWSDEIPNNWRSIFGDGPAWTLDPERGRYYLHNFAPEQPDVDWWNPEVRIEFDRILRFWFDRGVAGFRIDVAHALINDRELRDDPIIPGLGLRRFYSMHRPETHEILREWRKLADAYDPARVLLGEAYSLEVDDWVRYFGEDGDELDLAFAFTLVHADFDAGQMRSVVAEIEAALQEPGRAGRARTMTSAVSLPAGAGATSRSRAALYSCSSRCVEPRASITATSSRSPQETCRLSAFSTVRHLRAIRAARRCRGPATVAGINRGSRSRTRAAMWRTSAPTPARRSTSHAT